VGKMGCLFSQKPEVSILPLLPAMVQVFYLNVPVGYELLWKYTFENEEIIRWAQLTIA
jgi:hypothetical protein